MVVFLMWLFLSAYGVLLGALLNAEIERQTTCDTTAGPPQPMGERGAVLADLAEGGISMDKLVEKRARRQARHMRRAG
jgi:membrane protein